MLLEPLGSMPLATGSAVGVAVSQAGVTLHQGGSAGACALPDANDAEWLGAVTSSGAYVAELVAVEPTVILRVLTFDGSELWPDGREIGVDDTTVEDVRRFRKRDATAADVVAWLIAELTPDDGAPFTVVTVGQGEVDAYAFRLIGATILADVRLHDERLIVTRVTKRMAAHDERLILARGRIRINDATRMGRLSEADKQELARLARADNAYLAIWKEYSALEKEAARQAARDIGWAEYDRFRVLADGSLEFDLVLHSRSDTLRERIGSETVGLEAAAQVSFEDDANVRDAVIGSASVTSHGAIHLRPDKPFQGGTLPTRGTLAGSFTLDKVRITRRDHAQRRIAEAGTAPVRQMALILADQKPDEVGRVRRHDPLSQRVRQLLGGSPTQAQIQAVDLAINSRDIVVIQGPPGTGKTRVIAAIQARLAEIGKDASALSKRVLLTSYQHDAVANLVQSADDGTLPPVKLGRQENADDEAYLSAWTSDLQSRLEARYAAARPSAAVRGRRALLDRVTAYRKQPFDVAGTVELLAWLGMQEELLGAVAAEARRLAANITHTLAGASHKRSRHVVELRARSLRSTPAGYADDGPITARNALKTQAVFDLLTDAQRRDLTSAAIGDDPQLAARRLGELKRDILDRLLDADARSSVVASMPAVEALLQRAMDAADREVELSATAIDLAVDDFRDAVEHRPAEIRHSLETHTRALAATCQQAVSGSMRKAQTTTLFDTVIIDEAARANPLDLMIPLSLASERAVLVGDHRQLPQLLDDDLVPKLSAQHDKLIVSDVLSRSMFERLFISCLAAEQHDGTKRVVTLDRQFRMHPVLGSFVSEQFYAPFGEHLSNGNSDRSAFAHGLAQYAGAACGWIDVPHTSGGEVRSGTSISRPSEAAVIVGELTAALQTSTELTFGVITFYSGQVRAIWEALTNAGLAVRRGSEFDLNPSLSWLRTDRGLPRLRIGSVDAFQGREFDVVFLSTTRSSPSSRHGSNRFGFLVLPNRLCVAMSRQRKLLITVGDAALITSAEGRAAVPALGAFHDLTGGEHGFRRIA